MKFAVIGGDMRQAKLAELLARDGHEVSTFALDKMRAGSDITKSETVLDAAECAGCVIFPLPMSSPEGMLNAPLSHGVHTTKEVLCALNAGQTVCGGRVDSISREFAASAGIEIIDYLEREEFAVSNAVAAAEGAIGLIMEETAVTICNLKCLVIGFGRISKILCHRLHGLGARVTASGRKFSDLAWISAYGYTPVMTEDITDYLHEYDVVVNTVPARVLGAARLRRLKPGCLCLDLASKPGGLDFSAAAKLGVKAMWALSLPGEVAPVTSGAIIRDTVYNILSEKETSV